MTAVHPFSIPLHDFRRPSVDRPTVPSSGRDSGVQRFGSGASSYSGVR